MKSLFLFLLLLSVSVRAQIIEEKLQSSDFSCISNTADEEYLSFDVKKPLPFTLLIKSDICQLLDADIVSEIKDYDKSGYLLINGKLRPLELNEQYIAMVPEKVFYDPGQSSFAIVEFYLYSHIGTSMYRYAIFTFDVNGNIYYDELDFNKTQIIKSLYKKYAKTNRNNSLSIPFPKED